MLGVVVGERDGAGGARQPVGAAGGGAAQQARVLLVAVDVVVVQLVAGVMRLLVRVQVAQVHLLEQERAVARVLRVVEQDRQLVPAITSIDLRKKE